MPPQYLSIAMPTDRTDLQLGCSFIKAGWVGPAGAAFRKAIRYSSGDDGIAQLD